MPLWGWGPACTALPSSTHSHPHSFLERRRARPARECRMWEFMADSRIYPYSAGLYPGLCDQFRSKYEFCLKKWGWFVSTTVPAVGLMHLVSKTHTGLTMDTMLNPHNISTHTHTNAAHLAPVMSQRGGTPGAALAVLPSSWTVTHC